MEIGIIGLPQSGKTTILSALTRGRSEAGVHGSARQEVHAGVGRIHDHRLDALAEIFNPDKVVPVEITYWDVPGSQLTDGEGGIGGQLLNLLQSADALLQIARAFEDPSVAHINGSVDPYRDTAKIEAVLASSDLRILERRVLRIEANLKGAKGRERDLLSNEESLLQRIREALEQDVPVREQPVALEEKDILSNYQLLTAKPLLTVFNIGEAALDGAAKLEETLAQRYIQQGVKATSLCGKLEMELAQLTPEEESEFRESMGVRESGLDRVAKLSFQLLSLVSFFTYVSKEVRAWTVPTDIPAVKAAGNIHSDMERGFIRAEVVHFDDLARFGSVAQCKKQGLLRLEGKTYPVLDGDVITFLFNV